MAQNKIKRVIVIVLDGVGVGEAPDADKYGDVGSNSVGNTSIRLNGLDLPNLQKLGFGNIIDIVGVAPNPTAHAAWGKLQPISAGKDSITGHWELMGVYLEKPFPTYPNGFPEDLLQEFKEKFGLEFIGNKVASGTVIIQELGQEHIETGKPILYTSADSVFQIAAHEDVIPIEELYKICLTAREFLDGGEHAVSRVIARPFIGDKESGFTRTPRRHDFAIEPPVQTVLDALSAGDYEVHSIGKIEDLFSGRGITHRVHSKSNEEGLEALLEELKLDFEGMIFVNLVEFDMIYGHRNDPEGYAGALKQFDSYIPKIQNLLRPDDIVILTGDHGVDPTTPSTDHSREHVPFLAFGEPITKPVDLGTGKTFANIGATIADIFDCDPPAVGESVLKYLLS